jgi:hypothetical protein
VRAPVLEGKDFRAEASWTEWIFLSWSRHIDEVAKKRRITAKDLGALKPEESIEVNADLLEKAYAAQPKDKKNFIYAAMAVFQSDFTRLIILTFTQNMFSLAGPILSRSLSEYITDKDAELQQGLILLALLMFNEVLITCFLHEYICFYNHVLGLKSRHSVQCMMMRKVIKRTESIQKNFGPRAAQQVMHSVSRCLNIWDMK